VRKSDISRSLPAVPPASTPDFSARPLSELRAPLTAFGVARLVGNTYIRFPFVLITPLSRGLGIPIDTATAILGIRELGGLVAPFSGHHADRGHERRVMVLGGLFTGGACIGIALGGPLWLATVVLLIGGTAKVGLDTSQMAWIGHRVNFGGRARVIGLIETAWAGAFLIGVPICAWLTDTHGWQAPYVVVGLAMAVATVFMGLIMGADHPEKSEAPSALDLLRWRPPAGWWGLYAYAWLQPFAHMMIFAVAGDWFIEHLGMSLTGLGFNTVLIGMGELGGTTLTITFSDRIGKRRSTIIGMFAIAPLAVAIALVGSSAIAGVIILVMMAVAFEFSFVSAIVLFTEFAPESRGAGIGSMLAVVTVSRAFSAIVAGLIYVHIGIGAIGVLAAVCALAGGAAMVVGSTEPTPLAEPVH
jgi:DHA1 family inner membrane transport protein